MSAKGVCWSSRRLLHSAPARAGAGKNTGGSIRDRGVRPWAGIGAVLATAREAVHATKALAFTQDETEAALGRVLVPTADW